LPNRTKQDSDGIERLHFKDLAKGISSATNQPPRSLDKELLCFHPRACFLRNDQEMRGRARMLTVYKFRLYPTKTQANLRKAQTVHHAPITLNDQVRWPTPTQADADGRTSRMRTTDGYYRPEGRHAQSLDRAVRGFQAGPGTLNPRWVEWLMGFPLGWTDLDASETP